MSAKPDADHAELPISEESLADFQADVMGGLLRLNRRFGPVAAIQDGSLRVLFAFDPAYNKQLLSDYQTYHTRFFAIRGPKRSAQRRVTTGMFDMNGDQWKRNRRLLKDPFSLTQVASYRPAIQRIAEELSNDWRSRDELDVSAEMVRFALRVNSTILFGMDDSPAERRLTYEIGEQIAEWARMNHELGIGALVPNSAFTGGYEDLLRFSEGLEVQIKEMIARRRTLASTGRDVLSILVRVHDEQGGLSEEELVGQTSVLFAAAHMTTANSLTWTLYLLAQHPAVCRALMAELDASGPAPASGRPDPNSLLERVIRESLRILPASAYSQRVNTEPVDLGPFQSAPRGTPIVFSPFITHRLESIYETPCRFLPDRWLSIKPSLYEYLPFGAGPRMCVGGPLALEVLRLSIPQLLRGRRLRVVPGSEINAQIRSTVFSATQGVPMSLHEADGAYESAAIRGNLNELVETPPAGGW